MSYYRRLPFDVRVAMWVDEHPKFMREVGIAAIAMTIAGSVVFLCWAVLSAASAQDVKMTTNGTIGHSECTCHANGKTWACRKVRGDPTGMVQTVNRCWGGGVQLSCPPDKDSICQYVVSPPICSEPPLSDVCYAGDEPK